MPNQNNVVTMDHLRSRKQPTTRKIKIIMSSDVDEELQEAQRAAGMSEFLLGAAEEMKEHDPKKFDDLVTKDAEAKERLKAAEKAAEKDSVEFKFRSLGRKPFDKLVSEHQPTDEDREDIKSQGDDPNNLQWSPENFPPILMAKSIISPKLTLEDILEIWTSDDWEPGALTALFQTALAAQNSRRVAQVGNA